MSDTPKKKKFDMTNAIAKAEFPKEIPPVAHRGKSRIDWQPLINLVKQRGIVKLSEDEVVIGSVINGVGKEIKRQELGYTITTRKIDGKLYVFISKQLNKK